MLSNIRPPSQPSKKTTAPTVSLFPMNKKKSWKAVICGNRVPWIGKKGTCVLLQSNKKIMYTHFFGFLF
jgi:hypothetical protein